VRSRLWPHADVFTRLAPSRIHGVGVIAIRRIRKGTYLFNHDNTQIRWVPETVVSRLPKALRAFYEDFTVKENGRFGCPKNFNQLTPSWYLNHSDHPNVAFDSNDEFFALRDIRANEELTVDYSTYAESADPE